jgi:hypothetical protein
MTKWTLLICEGAHDQAFLGSLATTCLGWVRCQRFPASLPEFLKKTYPIPTSNAHGAFPPKRIPSYFTKRDSYLVIKSMGSDAEALGAPAAYLLEQWRPDRFGVFVDANTRGIENRQRSFRGNFNQIIPEAEQVVAGCVLECETRLGLWVAPDNREPGSMDSFMTSVARQSEPKLVENGHRFVTSLKNHTGNPKDKDFDKALLGGNPSIREAGRLARGWNKRNQVLAQARVR